MASNTSEQRDALLVRLRRVEDDIEWLSALEQTPEISAAIAALRSEASKLDAAISKLLEAIPTYDKIREARALRYRTLSFDEIAEKMGMSRTSVRRYCADIPVDKRKNAKPRLEPPVWLETAKAMSAEGKTRNVIARELGIPIANFYRAFNRFAGT